MNSAIKAKHQTVRHIPVILNTATKRKNTRKGILFFQRIVATNHFDDYVGVTVTDSLTWNSIMKVNYDEIESDEFLDRLFEYARSGIRIHGGNVYDIMRPSNDATIISATESSAVGVSNANNHDGELAHHRLVTSVDAAATIAAMAVLSDMASMTQRIAHHNDKHQTDVDMRDSDQIITITRDNFGSMPVTSSASIAAPSSEEFDIEIRQATRSSFDPLTNAQISIIEKLYLNKRNSMEAIEFQSRVSTIRDPLTVKSGYGEPTIKSMEKILQFMTEQCPPTFEFSVLSACWT